MCLMEMFFVLWQNCFVYFIYFQLDFSYLLPPSLWIALPSSSRFGTSTHCRPPPDPGLVTHLIFAYDSRVRCCHINDSTATAAFFAAFGSSNSREVVSWCSRSPPPFETFISIVLMLLLGYFECGLSCL
jgi:hypothetical protein